MTDRPGLPSEKTLSPPDTGTTLLHLLVGPLIALAALTSALALGAAMSGFDRDSMLLIAAGSGLFAAVPGLYLVWREVSERRYVQAALRDAEARVLGIVESAMDAIITVDESQRIVLYNHAAEEVFRWPREQAMGERLEKLIPERFRGGHEDLVKRFGATGSASRRMGRGARLVMGVRANGQEFPIEASISQIVRDGRRFFTVILRDVTERVKAEEDLRRSREELQALALASSNAREQEKSRIARELHDELGQALTALKIDVSWLRENTKVAGPDVEKKLSSMQVLLDGTVAAARRISSDLRPLMLDDLGLTAACDWLVHNFKMRTGIECELVLGQGDLDLPDPWATAVFRVLQESLTNVAKHADASRVEVTLERVGEQVSLVVHDDGRGFTEAESHKRGSFGLIGLKERAYLLQGTITVDSQPGRGTVIELAIPAPTDQESA